MAIVRLLFVVFLLAGCRQASESNTQNTPKKDDAVKQNNKTETITSDDAKTAPPPSSELVAETPLSGPPVVVVDEPGVLLPGYVGFPRTFGSGGPGRKVRRCPGPECPGFIALDETCGGFVDLTEECAGFITASN